MTSIETEVSATRIMIMSGLGGPRPLMLTLETDCPRRARAARRELLGEIVEDLGALGRLHRRHAVLLQHQVEGRVPQVARQALRLDQRHAVAGRAGIEGDVAALAVGQVLGLVVVRRRLALVGIVLGRRNGRGLGAGGT